MPLFSSPPPLSRFRHAAAPSVISSFALSLQYIVIPEPPLSFHMTAMLGLTAYDSDDDGDSPTSKDYYCLSWNPEVRFSA